MMRRSSSIVLCVASGMIALIAATPHLTGLQLVKLYEMPFETFWRASFFIFISVLVAGKLRSSGSETIIAGFGLLCVKLLLQSLVNTNENVWKRQHLMPRLLRQRKPRRRPGLSL